MDRTAKEQQLGEIKESFKDVASIVVVDYRGITVPVVTRLRDDLRKNGCHYRVLKNSLVKIAVKGSKMEPLSQIMAGTTAVIWSTEIPQTPAKLALAVGQGRAQAQDPRRLLRGLRSSMSPASTRCRACPARTRSAPRC